MENHYFHQKVRKTRKIFRGTSSLETKKKKMEILSISTKSFKITTYVDENGKELLPIEEGEKDLRKRYLLGYKFVETKRKKIEAAHENETKTCCA